ncbi:ubiquitin carboxyl-terminal hydrolase 8-like [Senna tora]|uniref:Ubiquitin carboxyl-terminal hydrolase n=1 Tax=Senna tora TaxID=362788 RepID=A0A834TCJ4_9FABA|nr:ubiquitin carboxyl-terminal hydrolase 8-like [Senna tora]
MTRFSEKIRLSSLVVKPTRFLSQKLTILSLSSFHFCKSLARFLLSKTLSFLTMDNFLADHDDYFWDLDSRPHRRFLPEQEPHLENEPLYLVLYRWWKEVEGDADRVESVLYTVATNSDSDSEVVLRLRKEDNHEEIINTEAGSSCRQYALVPEGLWLRALRRCRDPNNEVKDFGSLVHAEDCLLDLFPLQVRIFVSWETNSLVAKISRKENVVEFYKKACDIFSSDYNSVHILDFSGQTSQFFINENESSGQQGGGVSILQVLLELQVHGLSDSIKGNGSNEIFADRSPMGCSSHGGSVMMNGTTHNVNSYVTITNSFRKSSYRAVGPLGLAGLQNLGNTCFMNSAIQCLVHTPKLVDFFLGDYRKEINYENPLGMNGELALAFGDLLRKLWVPGARTVAPRTFKTKLANFAPQFSGYNQHDSQELLAFLLDGLHEDLNRVKRKPYHEVKDADGRPDEEVAEEYWHNHLARNDSIIVDLCQGQFRSTLVCPTCKKVSITFDPFMYLSLPLPSTIMRTITLTVLNTDGLTLPSTFTITLPKNGILMDLIGALGTACSLRDDETILVAEIYKNRICRLLEEPSDSLALIRDEDKLVAYRLPKDNEAGHLVVFMHQQVTNFGKEKYVESLFGIPIVARLHSVSCGYDIRTAYLKLINPFLMSTEDILDEYDNDDDVDIKVSEDNELGDASSSPGLESDSDSDLETDFKFYLPAIIGRENVKLKMNKPIPSTVLPKKLEVTVLWSNKMIKKYDTCLLSSLPEVCKPQLFIKRTQESVSIYKCLEAFLKEEPLGPEDMWYCPGCKNPQQATKKLDLWRLPEILVVHLKRFSFSRYFKNKLETFVDFPIDDLDLSTYIAHKNSPFSNHYELYAISCHYGGLGGGHYTAFVRYGNDKWYEFDDSRVVPASEDMIKTSAAYVLFYRRV